MALTITIAGGAPQDVSGTIVVGSPSPSPSPSGPTGIEFSPTMTGPSSPAGYAASATSEYSESGTTGSAWNVFNKITGSGWANGWSSTAQATSAAPQIVTLMLPAAKTCYTYSVLIRADDNTLVPFAWVLEGFGSAAWNALHTVSGLSWVNGETKSFTVPSPAAYSGYRLRNTSSGVLCQIDEWRLFS